MSNILTKDNAVHAMVCIGVVAFGGLIVGYPFAWAGLAALGIYLREAAQVGWRWGLGGSGHKIAEAVVGPVLGFGMAAVLTVV